MTWLKRVGAIGVPISLGVCVGCAATAVRDRGDVSEALRDRIGFGTTPTAQPSEAPFPAGLNVDDGLSEDEAVAVALWNNPAFQADLAALGIARAELIQAGLLRNPVLSLLFPVGPKQLEAGIAWQVESLWQRPRRVSMAQLNLEGVSEGLVQNGLALAMKVKIAHADLLLARERAALAGQRAAFLGEIQELAQARLRAGDISGVEMAQARGVALEAAHDADRLTGQVVAVRARLLGLLGVAGALQLEIRAAGSLGAALSAEGAEALPSLPSLLDRAWAARPDLRAAELRIEEAGKRAGLARSEYLSVAAVVDANAEGEQGFESGPGVALTLPLFDRGQGDRARAAAGLERAVYGYSDTRNRIAAEVREAYALVQEAQEALSRYRESIVRLRSEAASSGERSHAAGEIPYQDVLVLRARHVEELARQAEVTAELFRARARLEYAIGRDLDRPSPRIARSP